MLKNIFPILSYFAFYTSACIVYSHKYGFFQTESGCDCSIKIEIVGQQDYFESTILTYIGKILYNGILIFIIKRVCNVVENQQTIFCIMFTSFYFK